MDRDKQEGDDAEADADGNGTKISMTLRRMTIMIKMGSRQAWKCISKWQVDVKRDVRVLMEK